MRAVSVKVMVNVSLKASFSVPCHQAVSLRLWIGQRNPSVLISPQGYIEKIDICCPGRLVKVAVFVKGINRP